MLEFPMQLTWLILNRSTDGTACLIRRSKIVHVLFTCVSYAEARLSHRLDVRLSVCHTLVLYQNG